MVRFLLVWAAACLAAASVQAASVTPPPIEDYGKLPAMDFVTLSPSGQRYAFVATVGASRKLFVATTDNKPIESDDLGPLKIADVEWAGDDHVLVRFSRTEVFGVEYNIMKAELYSVICADIKHHKSFVVFGTQQNVVANTVNGEFGTAEIDGRWYGYFGGYTELDGDTGPNLYRVDLDTGGFTTIVHGQVGVSDWLVGPDGAVKARLRYSQATTEWRLLSGDFGESELAAGKSATANVHILGLGHTAESILLQIDEGQHDLIRELSLNGGKEIGRYDADRADSTLADRTSKLWIGLTPSTVTTPPTLFDAARQAKVLGAFKAFPGYVPRLTAFSADFNRMIVFTSAGDDSGTYWIVDIDGRSALPLGGAYPTIVPAAVGPVQWFNYKAADGLTLQGVLTLPPGKPSARLPIVVMPHGGPEAHDSLGFDYWAQAFASRGYAVFQPNFRGSDGYGKAFQDAGLGEWGGKMQTDISDGLTELARQGVVDPKRACIVGGSYGGYAALAGVTLQQGLYRCAVAYAGMSDLWRVLSDRGDESGEYTASTRYWKAFMGFKTRGEAGLKSISPAKLAKQADAPILLIHGQDDTVVRIDQSQAMEAALRQAGKPVEFVTLPKADHWLLDESSRVAMVKASVAFVMKNNPPDPAPSITLGN